MSLRVGTVGGVAVVSALLLTGCADGRPADEWIVSQSGGFVDRASRLAEATEDDAVYCAAERLRWRFAAGVLSIVDSRVLLSCTGVRTMSVERIDGFVEITEIDVPEAPSSRSSATCAYDFAAAIHIDSTEPVILRLLRDVTDVDSRPALLWKGELTVGDPSQSAAVVDATPASSACRTASAHDRMASRD